MTLLELTILGIVTEGSCHAYNVDKVIKKRGIRERLDIGFSTIYSTLKKMENGSLLESEYALQEKLPGRRVYSITLKGKQVLCEELKKALSQPQRAPSLFEIGLDFGKFLSHSELKESLSLYDVEIGRLIQLKVREITGLDNKDALKRALLSRPLALWRAERKWIRELMSLL